MSVNPVNLLEQESFSGQLAQLEKDIEQLKSAQLVSNISGVTWYETVLPDIDKTSATVINNSIMFYLEANIELDIQDNGFVKLCPELWLYSVAEENKRTPIALKREGINNKPAKNFIVTNTYFFCNASGLAIPTPVIEPSAKFSNGQVIDIYVRWRVIGTDTVKMSTRVWSAT